MIRDSRGMEWKCCSAAVGVGERREVRRSIVMGMVVYLRWTDAGLEFVVVVVLFVSGSCDLTILDLQMKDLAPSFHIGISKLTS